MSDNSQEILCGSSFIPTERLDEDEDNLYNKTTDEAIIESSSVDLLDNMGKPEFKYIYLDLIQDIKLASFNFQRKFILNALARVEEVYEYRFPINLDVDSILSLNECYEFIQFLEFDNVEFLGRVWKQLNIDIYKIDIDLFCQNNSKRIISECEKQIESFDFNKKISMFLRTYYKEGFIKWFIENTKPAKTEIKIAQLS